MGWWGGWVVGEWWGGVVVVVRGGGVEVWWVGVRGEGAWLVRCLCVGCVDCGLMVA